MILSQPNTVKFKVIRNEIEIDTLTGDFSMKNGEYFIDCHKEVDVCIGDIVVILLNNNMRFEVTHLSNNIDSYNRLQQIIEPNFIIFLKPVPIITPDYPIISHKDKV